MATGDTMCDDTLGDTGSNSSLDNCSDRVHGSDNLGLELRRNMKLDLLEKVLGGTETTDNQDILQSSVLRLDSNDLVAYEFQDAIDNGLKALENFFIGKRHVAFLDTSLWEFSLDTNINSPLLAVVAEISLDSIFKVHDALGVYSAGSLGAFGQFHLADLGSQNVTKVAVEGGGTARISGSCSTLGDSERVLVFDFVCNQIDSTTTAVNNEDGVVHLEVEKTSLGTEEGSGFGFGNEGQAIVVFVAQETSLDSSSSSGGFASIVPDGGDGEIVSDISLFSVKHFTKCFLERGSHSLAKLEEIIGGHIDFGFARGQGRQVDRVDVGISAKHQLELEPLYLLHARLGIASWSESICNIRAPAHHFLILVVVQDSRNLVRGCQRR